METLLDRPDAAEVNRRVDKVLGINRPPTRIQRGISFLAHLFGMQTIPNERLDAWLQNSMSSAKKVAVAQKYDCVGKRTTRELGRGETFQEVCSSISDWNR